MMFLLRMAFWLMVICLLLPGSPVENRRLISSAGKAVDDFRSFCERNAEVCNDARSAFTNVIVKVKGGVEVLETWMTAAEGKIPDRLDAPKLQPGAFREDGPDRPAAPFQAVPQWGDSLNPGDKHAPWRDPARL